jgi:hypothetical protein
MSTVINQSFVEDVDDSRTLFSMENTVIESSVQVFQGSSVLVPDAFFVQDSTHVRFTDESSQKAWSVDSPNTLYVPAHGLALNTLVYVYAISPASLPTGLDNATPYYVIPVATNTLQLSLFASGPVVTFTSDGVGTLYLIEPNPPLIADGTLYYNASLEDSIDTSQIIGFWTLSDFQEQYAPGASDVSAQDALLDADDAIQLYTTSESYADALAGGTYERLFRRVQGELGFYYLAQRPGTINQAKESEKTYADNIKKFRQEYTIIQSSILGKTEDDILSQLYLFKKEDDPDSASSTFSSTVWWGTGRFIGVLPEDDDDD